MKQKKLLCLDVDGTIFFKSLHNYLGEKLMIAHKFGMSITEELIIQYTDEFLRNPSLGWRNKERLVTLVKKAWSSEYEVALVSFNDYPQAVKYAMTKILKEDVEKLHIVSYLPAALKKYYMVHPVCDKQKHIEEAMQKAGVTNPANVLLIEDTLYNVEAAKKAGMKAVLIESQDTSFKIAFDALRELNKIHGVDNVNLEEPLTEPELEVSDSSEDVNMDDNQEDYKSDGECTEGQQGWMYKC
ncbi:HAD family hydrolase [Rickettsia bellii]|uniref:HAD family hydrolase n=1 Tax=Rickettsia bellii TaxID=33990 RepID=UPI0000DB1025|nr:HAD family hydrolase [Rickettsia bellii]